ncbi:hypothetical protein EDD85DRAFT_783054 [Armillaria nabsnona]|nr:hypothetical protein EDD85DRAFT_783054 [Armillaria nabsnona]
MLGTPATLLFATVGDLRNTRQNNIREGEMAEWPEVIVKKSGNGVESILSRKGRRQSMDELDEYSCSLQMILVLHGAVHCDRTIASSEFEMPPCLLCVASYFDNHEQTILHTPLTSSSVLKSAGPRFSIFGKVSSVRKDLGNADTTTRNRSAFPYQGTSSVINISSSLGATIHPYLGAISFRCGRYPGLSSTALCITLNTPEIFGVAQEEQLTSDISGASAMALKSRWIWRLYTSRRRIIRAILPLFYWNQAFKIVCVAHTKMTHGGIFDGENLVLGRTTFSRWIDPRAYRDAWHLTK